MTSTLDNSGSISLDLDELKAMLEDGSPARVVVAADWSHPSTAFAAIEAFAAMVAPGDPVELVLTVPHEPTEDDLRCVQVLLDEAEVDREIGSLQIESFTETAGQPYDVSVVPLGDDSILALELTRAVTRIHRVVSGAVDGAEKNRGDHAGLARRLATFAGQL